MKKRLWLFGFVLITFTVWGQPKNVLFIGNSITASGIPDMFREISQAKGKPVHTDFYWNGQLLREYIKDSNSIEMLRNKLKERSWDYVVLQENSAVSGFYPGFAQGYFEFYSYLAAKKISKVIREENPCTEVVFFMTYGYINGDQMNFPGDTYLNMQSRIRRNYKLLADSNSAIVAPVGMAWKQIRMNEDWYTELYAAPEDHHPGQMGTFLAGCVFYASIFVDDPSNSGYTAGIDPIRVQKLEAAAKAAVMDSIKTWNLRINVPNAKFTYESNQKSVVFTSLSRSVQVNHKWYFGDGDSSVLSHPNHIYVLDNSFLVTHIVESVCYPADTSYDTVVISTTHIPMQYEKVLIKRSSENRYHFTTNEVITDVQLFNTEGKVIIGSIREQNENSVHLDLGDHPEGVYLVRILYGNKTVVCKIIR